MSPSAKVGTQTSGSSVALRRALLPTLLASILAQHAAAAPAPDPDPAPAPEVSFDSSFFSTGIGPQVDLSRFEKGNVVLPGTYRGDVKLNNTWQARSDILLVAVPGEDNAQPCYDSATLISFGVDLEKVRAQTEDSSLKEIPEGRFCGSLGDYIPGASAEFDSGMQELSLSVPQIYINQAARGYVDPSQWDAGINAGVLGYTTNVYRSLGSGQKQTSAYLGLNASLKLGSWHAYTLGSLGWNDGRNGGTHYQNTVAYLQHDIPSLKAQLEVGDTFTPGNFFNSVRLRGVRLYSDERMLPQSLRGYAPVVRGIAETNAHIVIRQRGYIIYDTNVAPGPFAISDLYPTGYGGDLDVEVTEADGRVQRFSVPYSAVAQLLRPGQSLWSAAAGKVEQQNLLDAPNVMQATYQRGLSNLVTGYTGGTLANGYFAAVAGAALNTPVGAFSGDISHASNRTPGQRRTNGTSIGLGYNKNITGTGTNFALAAYRYSTSGYVGLNDAVAMRDAAARGYDADYLSRQRSRIDLNVNQSLGDHFGQVFLQGSRVNHWGPQGRQTNFSAGYGNNWKSLSYNFSAQRTLESSNQIGIPAIGPIDQIPGAPAFYDSPQTTGLRDTRYMLTFSLPLGRAARAPMLSTTFNHSRSAGNSSHATVSGLLGPDDRFNYSANVGRSDGGGTNVGVNGQYTGPLAQIGAGYSRGNNYTQLNASASGGVVIHEGGVTLSPQAGDTMGLVHAPDAAGATVSNSQGAKVDSRGYAVVPNLTPYQLNTITLDPKGADAGLELKSTSVNVAPRLGSVARLSYETSVGRAVMVETTLPNGQPVPFGADVLDTEGNSVGVAGQGSRLFVRDLPDSGTLIVKWGDGGAESCQIDVQLPAAVKGQQSALQTAQAACQPKGEIAPKASVTAEPDQSGELTTTTSPQREAVDTN